MEYNSLPTLLNSRISLYCGVSDCASGYLGWIIFVIIFLNTCVLSRIACIGASLGNWMELS
jgi:hypothetical protein